MVGTGTTDGMAATFDSGMGKGWSTKPIPGMKSDYPPAFAIRLGKNDGVAVFSNYTTGSLYNVGYATWNVSNGFGVVSDIDGTNTQTILSPAAVASANAIHVSYLEIGNGHEYEYAAYDGAAWNPKNEVVKNPTASLGFCSPGLTVLGSSVIILNPGYGDELLYSRTRPIGPAGPWNMGYQFTTMMIPQLVDDVTPAIVPLSSGPELLVVFTEKMSGKALYYLTRSAGTWSVAKPIPNASSIEVSLLALPIGGAILAYRHYTTNAIFWSRFDGTDWSPVADVKVGTTAKSKPVLALGAGDAEAELLFIDSAGAAQHARLRKDAMSFDSFTIISGATNLVGIAAATNL